MDSDEQRADRAETPEVTADERPADTGAEHPADSGAEDRAEAGGAAGFAEPDAVATKAERDRKLTRRLVFGSAALAVASFLAAALFGVLWWVAEADDNVELATARDEVVRVGSAAVKAFTELDHNNPKEFFDRSMAVSDEELAKQIDESREAYTKAMTEAKTTATTKVLDIAVDELNLHEGKARFLAAIQVEVEQGDKTNTKQMRMEVQMTRVDQGGDQVWKVSGISNVPVVGAGQ
ncbi:Mce-associated membrane protein [Amycolatopsis arida]|uniref:Mce-associated membrane protein n=1 Tax=Amycolatopsis arida TaxID=587909 RepID=A0A1I6A3U9_9PSEU|nr:hypothetical protein [Amycolatopsis arida]TDX88631.1 Mce-associated membrane protein [Amycolatopsis arida]SFQ63416.1 Mce-associated membrane protein [Amycolatopsis arida]